MGGAWRHQYDLWTLNRLSFLLDALQDHLHGAPGLRYANWVNGDMYIRTKEVFGVRPVPGG
jgi:hypothetical protein